MPLFRALPGTSGRVLPAGAQESSLDVVNNKRKTDDRDATAGGAV